MQIENDVPLQNLNTFGVPAAARYFAEIPCVEALREALAWAKRQSLRVIILGGGSNILFTGSVDALVLHMTGQGITVQDLGGGKSLISVAAGENWADLVWWAAKAGYGGLENLCLIPGTAGAAPVQNIGAYGAEFAEVCHSVAALNRHSGEEREFSPQDCAFGYRDSIFKRRAEEWVITGIKLLLDEKAPLRSEYGALREQLAARGKERPNFLDVAEAVAAIRQAKLPAPEDLGNAGSFFKNPAVPAALYEALRTEHPGLPGFKQPDGRIKLSAAWLLDTAGWKGKRAGRVGCYERQPLVLVNHGGADGGEILEFSEQIQADIRQRFVVRLEREPVVYP